MTSSTDHADTEFDWDGVKDTHEIMYVVKWLAYEFRFAVPRKQGNRVAEEQPLLQIRFKDQCQMTGFVLEIGQMEDFFEGLSRLMEYVRAEAAKRAGQL